ncbi:MAG: phosphatase PAP2 family protein [Oscillospiraceae bacterium]|nr:phosphatase PAP2 family protein [Oscillospiraceae bacterium]
MNLKKKTILSICLFFLIFGGLLITATFTDLQVSNILTKFSLPEGQYYADDIFGSVFETIGTSPEYFIGAFAFQIILIYITRFWNKKALKTLLVAAAAVASFGLYCVWFNEMFNYIFRHYDISPAFIWGVIGFLGCFTTVFGTLAVNNFSDESIKKMLKFAFVTLVAMEAAVLTVQMIKIPMGRMRYRAMNTINDFSYYTRWYVANGQPDKDMMRSLFGTTDACKSFPSGHTRAAASLFYFTTLIDVLGVKSKKVRFFVWIGAFLFTALVAVSRIMVGAHFFSDVLIGGTIGFVYVILSKEFFICGCSHIKSLIKR